MEKYNTSWPQPRIKTKATSEVFSKPSLTIPNLALDIDEALNKYSSQSIENKLKGYYEQEGMEMPDFDRMDRIERLVKLAEVRAEVERLKEEAEHRVSETERRLIKEKQDKELSEKVQKEMQKRTLKEDKKQ